MLEAVLATSAASLVGAAFQAISGRQTGGSRHVFVTLDDGSRVEITEIPDDQVAEIRAAAAHMAQSSAANPPALATAAGRTPVLREDLATEAALVGSAALALDPDAVFARARRRIDLLFKLRLGILVALTAVLICAIVGVLVSAAVGQGGLAAGLGVAGVADLFGMWVLKPIDRLRDSLNDTQRLDLIHLNAYEQLKACSEHKQLDDRLRCQRETWASIHELLRILSDGPHQPSSDT